MGGRNPTAALALSLGIGVAGPAWGALPAAHGEGAARGGAPADAGVAPPDEVLSTDARGAVVFPLDDLLIRDAVDAALLEAWQAAQDLLWQRRWTDAARAFSDLAARLPAVEVRYGAAVALFELERFADAEDHLRAVLAAVPDDPRGTNLLGLSLSAQGRGREAIPWFDRCLDAARRQGNLAFAAYALLNGSIAALETADPSGAESRARQALDLGERGGFGNVRSAAYNTLGNVALHRGDRAGAEDSYLLSLKIERKGRGTGNRAVVLSNLSHLRAAGGRGGEALEGFDQALVEARNRGDRAIEASILAGSAGVLADLGRDREADLRLGDARRAYEALGLPRGIAEVRLEQARQALHRGDGGAAAAHLDEAEALLGRLELPVERADARYLRAALAALGPDPAGAEALAADSERAYLDAGQAEGVARALGLRGDIRRAAGDLAGAERLYREALSAYERSGMRTAAADTRGRLAHVLVGAGRVDQGLGEARAAREAMSAAGRHAALSAFEDELGVVLDRGGRVDEALSHYESAEQAGARASRDDLAAHARRNRATALLRLGRLDEAEGVARQVADPELMADVARARALAAHDRGVADLDARRLGPAGAAFRAAIAAAPLGPKGEDVRGAAHGGLARVHQAEGRLAREQGRGEAAGAAFDQAVEAARASGQDRLLVNALWDQAAFLADAGDRAGALPKLDEAVAVAVRLPDPAAEARLRLLSGNARAPDDPEVALRELGLAADLAARLPDGAAIEAKARNNLGVLLLRREERERALAELSRARDLFQAAGESGRVKEVETLLAAAREALREREAAARP